jgi:hypothetical protein
LRSEEYLHVDLSGDAVVEERRVLAETVEQVRCRWCNGVNSVELVPRPGATSDAPAADSVGGAS